MSDNISRADAIRVISEEYHNRGGNFDGLDAIRELETLPSKGGDAEILNEDFRPKYMQQCPNNGADLISRADAINAVVNMQDGSGQTYEFVREVMFALKALPSADAVQGEWIPCSEKMPKELERVNVTWLNHNPPFYYQHIKDIPQTDTAVYYRGKWYWWDVAVIDVLAEYGEDCNAEQIDKDIEVVAWMPLPKPYECGARMKGGAE